MSNLHEERNESKENEVRIDEVSFMAFIAKVVKFSAKLKAGFKLLSELLKSI